MATELIINASLPETRIALQEDGEIQELLIERASGKGIVGNIYKGRVTRVLPGMQAAFVDIGLEKAAFLYVDDVYVHSEIWEQEEGDEGEEEPAPIGDLPAAGTEGAEAAPVTAAEGAAEAAAPAEGESLAPESAEAAGIDEVEEFEDEEDLGPEDLDDDEEEDDDTDEPVRMGPPGDSDGNGNHEKPAGTIAPDMPPESPRGESASGGGEPGAMGASGGEGEGGAGGRGRRHRRGRRGGRFRRGGRRGERGERGERSAQGQGQGGQPGAAEDTGDYPENYVEQVQDRGDSDSDRAALGLESQPAVVSTDGAEGRPPGSAEQGGAIDRTGRKTVDRADFKAQRGRDRRIRSKTSSRPSRAQVNIQDLLKEGQEVLVQVAKDPISTKGARLTCHISLPGRHLVCMPTIDHVGVSRRIERDDERRKLREAVERYRPKNLGFIVRTASGKQQSEQRIKQDIEYLSNLWNEIREKAAQVTAPALVYEDLNSVLRSIRDWVTEEIDKIVVDSRYHFNEIHRFAAHFMPSLKSKVELYHGDIPIFDAYNISTELSRALERKVWLKSGGYIVVDQAEALVAIDVNTGRYVGKKNLEDTILKTNLEAVQEIAYQLRLRNCGGIIILDLIDMEKEENKHRVYRALEEALKKDRARPTILKISELGLVEMTRKRTRDTIIRTLCESCTHCEGKGFIKSKQTVAYEVLREIEREGIERDMTKILVQAHPDVIDILAIDERETLDQLERRYRKQIYLQAVQDFHPEQFEVVGDKRDRKEGGEYSSRGSEREGRDRGGRDRDRGRSSHSRDRDRGGRDRNRDRDRSRDRDRDRDRDQERPGRLQIQTQSVKSAAPETTEAAPAGENVDLISNVNMPTLGEPNGGNAGPQRSATPGAPDGFYDEEDRLAFLRAQAAQDAALARMQAGGVASTRPKQAGDRGPSQDRGGAGRNAQDRGGRRGRRGRRGGSGRGGGRGFRRDERGAKPSATGSGEGSQGGGTEASSGSSNDTGNSGGGGGGGGDRSQPPVT